MAVAPTRHFTDSDWQLAGLRKPKSLRERLWQTLWFLLLPAEERKTTPTVTGFVLILVCLGLGVAAYNAGSSNNILFLALSLLLSGILLSGLLSGINFGGLRWRLVVPPHLRVNERVDLQVELGNAKRWWPTFSMRVKVAARRSDITQDLFLGGCLRAGQQCSLKCSFTPPRRGWEQLRVASLASSYPFGFLDKLVRNDNAQKVLVWPARVDYELVWPGGQLSHRSGQLVRRPGSGEQLYNIRRYHSGDHQRLVHWKATARMKRLMVRQLMEEQQDGFALLIDPSRKRWLHEAQFENLCSLAAALAEDLFAGERFLAYAIGPDGPHPVARVDDLHRFLDKLALLSLGENASEAPRIHLPQVLSFEPSTTEAVYVALNGRRVGGTL